MRYFDNDMDELFNKAGNEYPLNTGKKDWNAVQKALATEEEAPLKATTGKNFKRFYPLLILLLLLPVLFYVLDNNADRSIAMRNAAIKNNLTNKSTAGSNKKDANNINNKQTNSSNDKQINNGNKDQEKNSNDNQAKDLKNNQAGNLNDNAPTDLKTNNTNNNNTNNNGIKDSRANNLKSQQAANLNNQPNHLDKNDLSIDATNITVSNYNIASNNNAQEKNLNTSLFPFNLYDGNFVHPYASIAEPQVKKDEPASAPPSTKKKPSKLYPSFYYGVMVGPDLSTIKYQEIRNVGSGVGLLLGYRFSQHWSVEASGFWSTKKYYTDGKYFNKASANIPAYVDLYFLDGGCQMVELPIDVRYQFTPGRNSFFLTAGLNSYFMKKESYDYKADASGSVYNGHRNYKNSGSNIFSNLQISGGYQHKLFSKIVVRIEPYLQVPLREVGIGKMPIASAGVHFGLVRESK